MNMPVIAVDKATGVPALARVVDNEAAGALFASSCANYVRKRYTVGVCCRGADLNPEGAREGNFILPRTDGNGAEVACCLAGKEVFAVLRSSKYPHDMACSAAEEFAELIESWRPIRDCYNLQDILRSFNWRFNGRKGSTMTMSVVCVLARKTDMIRLAYAYVGNPGFYHVAGHVVRRMNSGIHSIAGSAWKKDDEAIGNRIRCGTFSVRRGEAVVMATDACLAGTVWGAASSALRTVCYSGDAMAAAENIVMKSPKSSTECAVVVLKP